MSQFRHQALARRRIGRVATDPVLRYSPKGVAVTKFRLANNGTYEVQFHTIVAWRGLAEIAAKYLSKGRLVYISGRLSSRSWTGQDGAKRWAPEIIAEDIQFLSAKAAGYPQAYKRSPSEAASRRPAWWPCAVVVFIVCSTHPLSQDRLRSGVHEIRCDARAAVFAASHRFCGRGAAIAPNTRPVVTPVARTTTVAYL